MNKKIKIIASISILLNVLLIGALTGNVFKITKDNSDRRIYQQQQLNDLLLLLPENTQNEFSNRVKTINDLKTVERQRVRKLKEEIIHVLNAEVFDAESYDLKSLTLIELRQSSMVKNHELIKDIAQLLTRENRKKLAGIAVRLR